jgi:hypothetical protein
MPRGKACSAWTGCPWVVNMEMRLDSFKDSFPNDLLTNTHVLPAL